MKFKNRDEMDPQSLANELLHERDTIARFVGETRALRARVASYETRYGLKSEEIHQAIEDGRLPETEEVCDWIIDYESLEKRNAALAG